MKDVMQEGESHVLSFFLFLCIIQFDGLTTELIKSDVKNCYKLSNINNIIS